VDIKINIRYMSLLFLSTTPTTTTSTTTRGECCRRHRYHQQQQQRQKKRFLRRFSSSSSFSTGNDVALSLEEEEEEEESMTVESVMKILREESRSHPTFFPRERISSSCFSSSEGEEGEEEVRFTSDVFSFRGSREEFSKLQSRWERRLSVDLKDVQTKIDACSSVDRNVFLVRWNVTFVPAKLVWLQNLAQNWPFGEVDVERRDILHKMGETTRFTYKALFQTLKRMAIEKKLTMPVAKIEGQTKLTFNSANEKLTSIEESLSLVDSVNSNRVRNKRICRDLLEFLDTRKPIGVDYKEYDLMVEDKVDIYSVPGMRTLDVDGLEDQQGQIEDVTTVLGFLTLFVLSFGVGIGSWYFEALRKDALMQKMLDGADFY
jgi:hypothetical protein